MSKGKCQYYSEKSKRCSIGFCRHDHRISDGSCRTSGIIDDLYPYKEPVHYYFKSRGKL